MLKAFAAWLPETLPGQLALLPLPVRDSADATARNTVSGPAEAIRAAGNTAPKPPDPAPVLEMIAVQMAVSATESPARWPANWR
ncbi:hypothetical protein [Mangrovicoccus ximenensis]|uniref:hypothetical protein n=1 Tax=Mangrovicoccus ximenensis TaxID=1911570 RepID=UPI000D378330|nr:hypothetical protein [Mangrovicoccus ximenensis]